MFKDNSKFTKLVIGLVMDALGCISYFFPGIGEYIDFIWAPISAFVLVKMYNGKVGKVGGIINFLEEISPGLDIIPTFTITWIYEYYFNKNTIHKK